LLATAAVFLACLYVIGLRADRIHAGRAVTKPGAVADGVSPVRDERSVRSAASGSVTAPARYRGLTAAQWARRYRHRTRQLQNARHTLRTSSSVTEAIGLAATAYGVSESFMRSLSWCESKWNRHALNPSSSTGLFQILVPSTWGTTPFARFSPWSAYANAMAAAYMLAHGRRSEWVC